MVQLLFPGNTHTNTREILYVHISKPHGTSGGKREVEKKERSRGGGFDRGLRIVLV